MAVSKPTSPLKHC